MNYSSSKVNILGVNIENLDVESLHTQIYDEISAKKHSLILHVNIYGLNLAYENNWLRDFYNCARLVFCDGMGVIVAAQFLGFSIQQRITYADWMWQLAEFAENNGLSIYLLGSKPGVSHKAAVQLKSKFHKLNIVGHHHGYFDKTYGNKENIDVINEINAVKPNILIVGFGMPTQEKWLMENWNHLNANIALTGGAVFDYVSGEMRRAPTWMTNNGLEWFGRLIIEPKRLWRRYLIGIPQFYWRIILQRFGLLKI